MEKYSGTFLATLGMLIVPEIVKLGFDESCANQLVGIGVPLVVAVAILVWRHAQGGVKWTGGRTKK